MFRVGLPPSPMGAGAERPLIPPSERGTAPGCPPKERPGRRRNTPAAAATAATGGRAARTCPSHSHGWRPDVSDNRCCYTCYSFTSLETHAGVTATALFSRTGKGGGMAPRRFFKLPHRMLKQQTRWGRATIS